MDKIQPNFLLINSQIGFGYKGKFKRTSVEFDEVESSLLPTPRSTSNSKVVDPLCDLECVAATEEFLSWICVSLRESGASKIFQK